MHDNTVFIMTKGADLSMIDRIDFSKSDFQEVKNFMEEDLN
jgi:hypothetical protein